MLRLLLFSLLASSIYARPQSSDHDDDDDDDVCLTPTARHTRLTAIQDEGFQTSSGSSSVPPSTTSGNSTGATVPGDSICSNFMCVTAKVIDPNIEYTLTSVNSDPVGWMSIGFGTKMINVPLLVVWESNGEVILSHRSVSDYVMPEVDPNPPIVATLAQTPFSTSSGRSSFTFTVPNDGSTSVPLVWGYSPESPSSAAVDATIAEHNGFGRFLLDLTKSVAAGSDSLPTSSISNGPLTTTQKLVVAHGILLVIGFMVVLPLGSLWARYLRTFTGTWFKAHRALQFYIGCVIITAGVALGIAAVSNGSGQHLSTGHRKWGIGIFVLYWIQIGLGLFIHHVKRSVKRPPQNYVHAVLGLIIIGVSFYVVREGYREEIFLAGFSALPKVVDILWYIWAAVVVVLYLAGLFFLRKQYRQEKESNMAQANTKNLESGYPNEANTFLLNSRERLSDSH